MSRTETCFRRGRPCCRRAAGPIGVDRRTLVGAIVLSLAVSGCSRRGPAAEDSSIVYVCSETKEVFVGPPQSVPAVHPETGRRTLLRGVYCPQCGRWYALPPPDHASGNPQTMVCRVHNVPMQFDGPVQTDRPASGN